MEYPSLCCLDLRALPAQTGISLDRDDVGVWVVQWPRKKSVSYKASRAKAKPGWRSEWYSLPNNSQTRLPVLKAGSTELEAAKILLGAVRTALKKVGLEDVAKRVLVRPRPWWVPCEGGLTPQQKSNVRRNRTDLMDAPARLPLEAWDRQSTGWGYAKSPFKSGRDDMDWDEQARSAGRSRQKKRTGQHYFASLR